MVSINAVLREHEVKLAQDTNLLPYTLRKSSMIAEKDIPSLLTRVNLRPAFTTAGDYELVIKLPDPIYSFHKAIPGTVDEFRGRLKDIFPEISTISKEDMERISRKRDISD